jgi:hypothetical protein
MAACGLSIRSEAAIQSCSQFGLSVAVDSPPALTRQDLKSPLPNRRRDPRGPPFAKIWGPDVPPPLRIADHHVVWTAATHRRSSHSV